MNDTNQRKQIPNNAGNINERLLRRFNENNLGRIESAHIKLDIKLYSPEAKRYFMRMYYPMQGSVHYITAIARMHLAADIVEEVEAGLKSMLKTVSNTIDTGTARVEKMLTKAGIRHLAEYHVPPVDQNAMVFSPFGKQYLDIISRFDHLMLMVETLAIHNEIEPTEMAALKVEFKKPIRSVAQAARLARNKLYRLAREGGAPAIEGDDDDDVIESAGRGSPHGADAASAHPTGAPDAHSGMSDDGGAAALPAAEPAA